jgi:hypothetical protein
MIMLMWDLAELIGSAIYVAFAKVAGCGLTRMPAQQHR